jgi:hypothetical protein
MMLSFLLLGELTYHAIFFYEIGGVKASTGILLN